jgi:TolA-binding protein
MIVQAIAYRSRTVVAASFFILSGLSSQILEAQNFNSLEKRLEQTDENLDEMIQILNRLKGNKASSNETRDSSTNDDSFDEFEQYEFTADLENERLFAEEAEAEAAAGEAREIAERARIEQQRLTTIKAEADKEAQRQTQLEAQARKQAEVEEAARIRAEIQERERLAQIAAAEQRAQQLAKIEAQEREAEKIRAAEEQARVALEKQQQAEARRQALQKQQTNSRSGFAPVIAPSTEETLQAEAKSVASSNDKKVSQRNVIAPTTASQAAKLNLSQATQQQYKELESAKWLVKSGDLTRANLAFISLLDNYGKTSILPDILYWHGEVYYLSANYDKALRNFALVKANFSSHALMPDTLLKIGAIHKVNGDTKLSNEVYQQLVNGYPNSKAAKLVKSGLY